MQFDIELFKQAAEEIGVAWDAAATVPTIMGIPIAESVIDSFFEVFPRATFLIGLRGGNFPTTKTTLIAA